MIVSYPRGLVRFKLMTLTKDNWISAFRINLIRYDDIHLTLVSLTFISPKTELLEISYTIAKFSLRKPLRLKVHLYVPVGFLLKGKGIKRLQ